MTLGLLPLFLFGHKLEQIADLDLEIGAKTIDCVQIDSRRSFLIEQCDRVPMQTRIAGDIGDPEFSLAHES